MKKHTKKIVLVLFNLILLCWGFSTTPAQEVKDVGDTDQAVTNDDSTPQANEKLKENYSIRSGDTLWDICRQMIDNPWYWPKLWSINQYILNPNIIYPGNVLVFSPATETTYPNFEVVQNDSTAAADDQPQGTTDEGTVENTSTEQGSSRDKTNFIVEPSSTRKSESISIKLRPISFVSVNGIDAIGRVAHSNEPKLELNYGDKVYLKFYRKIPIKIGDRFEVIERIKTVFDPDRDSKKIGLMIRKKAVLTVTHLFDDSNWKKRTVEAAITDGDDAVVRDDEIIPYESELKSVVPHFTDKAIYGKIVEADSEQFLISNNDFVFLNIGTKDGLQPGLQLYVVRRGDGLFDVDDDKFPDISVARIIVVEAFEKTATAYVTTLDRSLSVGDRVRSKVE